MPPRAHKKSEISAVLYFQPRIAILVNESTPKVANDAEITIPFILYPVSEAIAASNFRANCKVYKVFPSLLVIPTDDPAGSKQMLCCCLSARLRLDKT